MLALGVFLLTLGEFLLYCGLGGWLWAARDWSVAAVLALALGCAVAVRALVTVYLFAVTELYKSPRPQAAQLGPLQAFALFVREGLALGVLYTTVHTLDRWIGLRDPRVKPDDDRPPVLLLHGFFCNSAFWWILRRELVRLSYDNVFTQTLEPVFGDIDRLGEQVHDRIEAICAATRAKKVIIVAHSMGGLAARACLRRHGGARVLKLICIGTPHHGTVHARAVAVLGKNLRQMRVDSPWLEQLNRAPSPAPITNIWSRHDNIVAPQDSCTLHGAKNIALAGVGHLEMAIAPSVRELIVEEIRGAAETPVAQPA